MTTLPDHIPVRNRNRAALIRLVHATGIAAFILIYHFYPASFELKAIQQLYMAEATAAGVDVAARVALMYQCVCWGGLITALCYFLFRYLEKKTTFRFERHTELLLFSIPITILAFLHAMDIQAMTVLKILHDIFWLRLFLLLPVNDRNMLSVLKDKAVFASCLISAFFLLFAVFVLWGDVAIVRDNKVWTYMLLVAACMLLYSILCGRMAWSVQKASCLLLPLASVPVLAFVLLEIVFYIRQAEGYFVSYRWLFGLSLIGVWAIGSAWLILRKGKSWNSAKMTQYWTGPMLVVAFVLLTCYVPVLAQTTETFENANVANSVMSVFRYGRIPMLDFMSSHVLSEQWFGYLYTLIFGSATQMDLLVYGFLNILLYYMVLYIFLNRLFRRPLLSVFFIVLFPFVDQVFFAYVFIGIIPLFFILRFLERPSVAGFFAVLTAVLALIFWKIDTGVAALTAFVIFFPLPWILSKKRFPLKAGLSGTAIFLGMILGISLVAMVLRPPAYILMHLKMSVHYFSANQAHGYRQIADTFHQQFYVYYILFPLAAVVLSIYILMVLKRIYASKQPLAAPKLLLAALFLFFLFLANMQRGIVRHGFAENGDVVVSSTFFAALGLLIVHWCRTGNATLRILVFFTSCSFAFILLKFFPFRPEGINADRALVNNAFLTIQESLNPRTYQGRTHTDTAFVNKNYKAFKQFLDNTLQPEQTFLDFSNAPMLYFYCQRRVPGYFSQNLQNTVDDYLQFKLLEEANPADVPVVVFSNYPSNVYDAMDGVPNVLRYYLIAEHIFRYYKPYGILNGKSIFISKAFRALPPAAESDTLITATETMSLGLLPEYTAQYYSNNKHATDLQTVFTRTQKDTPVKRDTLILPLDSSLLNLGHCYLAIDFTPAPQSFEPYPVSVALWNPSGLCAGSFTFTRRDKVSTRYMIRMSNHYFWHSNTSLELRISHAAEISRITIEKDIRMKH